VMSLWFVAFQGSTPIGGPIVGLVMAAFGARAGLGIGALTCLVVAAAGAMFVLRRREALAPVSTQPAAVGVEAAVDVEAAAPALVEPAVNDSEADVVVGCVEAAAPGPTALTRERPPRRSATAAAHHRSERASSAR